MSSDDTPPFVYLDGEGVGTADKSGHRCMYAQEQQPTGSVLLHHSAKGTPAPHAPSKYEEASTALADETGNNLRVSINARWPMLSSSPLVSMSYSPVRTTQPVPPACLTGGAPWLTRKDEGKT